MIATTMRQPRRRSRVDDVFDAICLYARDNAGITPSSYQLADDLGLSQQRVNYLMMRLETAGRITWLSKHKYKVNNSTWDPPPDVEL